MYPSLSISPSLYIYIYIHRERDIIRRQHVVSTSSQAPRTRFEFPSRTPPRSCTRDGDHAYTRLRL